MRTVIHPGTFQYGVDPRRYDLLDLILNLSHLRAVAPYDQITPNMVGDRMQYSGPDYDVWFCYEEVPTDSRRVLKSYRVCYGHEVSSVIKKNGVNGLETSIPGKVTEVGHPQNLATVFDVTNLKITGDEMTADRIQIEWRRDDIECRNNGPAVVTAQDIHYVRGQPPTMIILHQKWHDKNGVLISGESMERYLRDRDNPLELTAVYYPFSESYFHSAQDEMIWIDEWNSIGTGLT